MLKVLQHWDLSSSGRGLCPIDLCHRYYEQISSSLKLRTNKLERLSLVSLFSLVFSLSRRNDVNGSVHKLLKIIFNVLVQVWARQGLAQTVPLIYRTFPKKNFVAPQKSRIVPQTFVPLRLIFLVLTCQNETAKKSNDPLMIILIWGSFNFIDLIEKRNQTHISPKLQKSIT